MKKMNIAWLLFFFLGTRAQVSLPSYSVAVNCKMTTNIIFPYRIAKADIGSSDVIGQKDPALQNVLFLKASRKGFPQTNLSVYTTDGKFYSFIVRYKEEPDTLNLSFLPEPKQANPVVDSLMDERLDSDAAEILIQPSFLHRKSSAEDIKAVLNGIYVKDDRLWVRITIKNHSGMEYRPLVTKFSIQDGKSVKRTAAQESEIDFCWRSPVSPVAGHGKSTLLFAFPSFTLSERKKLVFQLEEKNGERTVILDIPSTSVLKSRPVL
jgi:conjugative transposon TraN protein